MKIETVVKEPGYIRYKGVFETDIVISDQSKGYVGDDPTQVSYVAEIRDICRNTDGIITGILFYTYEEDCRSGREVKGNTYRVGLTVDNSELKYAYNVEANRFFDRRLTEKIIHDVAECSVTR